MSISASPRRRRSRQMSAITARELQRREPGGPSLASQRCSAPSPCLPRSITSTDSVLRPRLLCDTLDRSSSMSASCAACLSVSRPSCGANMPCTYRPRSALAGATDLLDRVPALAQTPDDAHRATLPETSCPRTGDQILLRPAPRRSGRTPPRATPPRRAWARSPSAARLCVDRRHRGGLSRACNHSEAVQQAESSRCRWTQRPVRPAGRATSLPQQRDPPPPPPRWPTGPTPATRAAPRAGPFLLESPAHVQPRRGLWAYTGMASDGGRCTMQSAGMGGPSAEIVLHELIAPSDVTRAIRVGTCGALDPRTRPRRPRGRAPRRSQPMGQEHRPRGRATAPSGSKPGQRPRAGSRQSARAAPPAQADRRQQTFTTSATRHARTRTGASKGHRQPRWRPRDAVYVGGQRGSIQVGCLLAVSDNLPSRYTTSRL